MLKAHSHPQYWYSANISGSFELMDAYVIGIEDQIDRSIEDFRQMKKTDVIDGEEEERLDHVVEHHMGLADYNWNIYEIFEEYFPNLQRRSALITLFSFFENELDKLCVNFRDAEKYTLGFKDLKSGGYDRATEYLEKVANLGISRNTAEWMEIKQIQGIRNLFVHADGRVTPERKSEIAYANSCPTLSVNPNDEIQIHKGFLKGMLGTFDTHFRAIDAAIKAKYTT